jgi:hypothetical protein
MIPDCSTFDKPALELVRLGDANEEAYKMLMGLFRENLTIMAWYNDNMARKIDPLEQD